MLFALGAVSSAARSAQDADVVEIVVGAIRRFDAGYRQSVRPHRRLPGFDWLGAEQRLRRLRSFANLAGDHERTAGRAGPVHDRFELGDQPVGRAEGSVLADRCQRRRQASPNPNSRTRSVPAGPTSSRPTTCFQSSTRIATAASASTRWSSALKGGKGHHHHHVASPGGFSDSSGSNSDPLMQALSGASSTSVTNSDGSTTTTLTYADGSKVTMTSAAAAAAAGSATSSYNFIEQLIQRQANAISAQASSSFRSAPEAH